MLLLQEQKRELEGKVESLGRTPEGDSDLSAEPLPAKETRPSSQSANPSSLEQVPAKATASADKSYTIREILQDEGDSENSKRKHKVPQQTDRRESVQNVLKLLNLRKQPGIYRMDSVPNLVVSTGAQRSQSQRSAAKVPEGIASSGNTSSPKRHARDTTVRGAMSFAANDSMGIREQQPDQSVTSATRIPSEISSTPERPPTHVFPLRYDHDMEASSLKLLGPNSTKSISLKTKQFTFQERETRGVSRSAVRKVTLSDGNIVDTTSLRTASAQIEKADQEQAPEAEQSKTNFEQQWIKVPVTKASETQSEVEKNDTKDTQEASIQCKFQEKAAQEFQKTASDEDTSRLLRKYPVFVDLEPKSNSERSTQRYLQVVRCAKHNGQGSSASEASRVTILREISPNDAILSKESTTPEKTAIVSLSEHTTPSETVTDGHPSVLSEKEIQAHEHDRDPGRLRSLRNLYRSRSQDKQAASPETQKPARESDRERLRSLQELYRNHFIVSSSSATDLPKSDEKRKVSISSGWHSLLGLKEDMERMNTRLAHLEHCANEIDEDFKDSHH
uniref:Uncharacterized protein n=1 Tax=Globisporangium ultimum (strain ATCC 200006 / CBS 805.95 / DAOM BR144) TaxID=431595 RepID=K3WZ07_GLOUD